MSFYYKITLTFLAIAVAWVLGYTIYYQSTPPVDMNPAVKEVVTEIATEAVEKIATEVAKEVADHK